jgi:hypothetical protein
MTLSRWVLSLAAGLVLTAAEAMADDAPVTLEQIFAVSRRFWESRIH